MEKNLEFLGFIETKGEKHLGLASIRINKQIVLRYKIIPKKDGNGHFPAGPKYKIADASGDRYIDAFMIDSRSENEEIEHVIMKGFKEWQKKNQPSVFDTNSKGDDLSDEIPF